MRASSTGSPTISVCVICRDEEDKICRCLDNIKGGVDQIVVVDTGSEDRTVELVKRFTDDVFYLDWSDDFSRAKNFAISKADKDWVLVLDADEVLPPDALQSLKSLMLSNPDVDGFFLDRHEFVCDYSKIRPDDVLPWPAIDTRVQPMLRLMRRSPDLKYSGKVHEHLELGVFTRMKKMHTHISFAHYMDKAKEHDKHRYYFGIEKRSVSEDPRNTNAHYNLLATRILKGQRSEFNDDLEKIGYIDPRYMHLFEDLVRRAKDAGWHAESVKVRELLSSRR